jgi:hypothetical protein
MMMYPPPRPGTSPEIPQNVQSTSAVSLQSSSKRKRKSNTGKGADKGSDDDIVSGSDVVRAQAAQQANAAAAAIVDMKKRTKTQRACDSCRSRKIRFVKKTNGITFWSLIRVPPLGVIFYLTQNRPLANTANSMASSARSFFLSQKPASRKRNSRKKQQKMLIPRTSLWTMEEEPSPLALTPEANHGYPLLVCRILLHFYLSHYCIRSVL